MNPINHCGDPHLRKQEDFGALGNTVKIGGETFVACKVIGAPPHTSCTMYAQCQARNEKLYRKKLIESGEFGKRDNKIERLGFGFKNMKKKKSWKSSRLTRIGSLNKWPLNGPQVNQAS